MKKHLVLTLVVSIFLGGPATVLARSQKNDARALDQIKTKIIRLGVGEKARAQIKLKDGQKIKGYVTNTGTDDFVFADRKTGQSRTIAYADVTEVSKPGISKRTKIIIGVAIGVVATAAILAWAVVHSLNNFDFRGIAIR